VDASIVRKGEEDQWPIAYGPKDGTPARGSDWTGRQVSIFSRAAAAGEAEKGSGRGRKRLQWRAPEVKYIGHWTSPAEAGA